MRDYVLVSDSTSDLPSEIIEEFGIKIVPFSYAIEDEVFYHYNDKRDDVKGFYDKIRSGAMPVTSQINPGAYEDFFEEILNDGKDIIYLCFTSGLSGSYQTSMLAIETLKEKFPEAKIICVDTLSASVGQGVLVYEAALKKKDGMTIEELEKWVLDVRTSVRHWFMVEDLFHLKRGGRIGAVSAIVGSALKINPILSVDEEGKLIVKAKARGTAKAIEYLVSRVVEESNDLENQIAVIGNADSVEKAEKIKKLVIEAGMKPGNILISSVGPIIGTHVGPGMAAIAFVTKM